LLDKSKRESRNGKLSRRFQAAGHRVQQQDGSWEMGAWRWEQKTVTGHRLRGASRINAELGS
jgi:hypothetical protein